LRFWREIKSDKDRLREFAAFLIAVLALVLAVSGVGDANATREANTNNVLAADAYAFFQAKNIRQTDYELAADELETLVATSGGAISSDLAERLDDLLTSYRSTIERYESEPDPSDPDNPLKGEGKVELLARAAHYEEEREDAHQRDENFDYATVASSMGIVLASAGILIASPRFILAGAVAGLLAIIFLINAALSLVHIDFFIT
jgi:hypothetical protein